MEINKVKLIGSGFKGACADWTEERIEKNGRKYVDPNWREKNDPIHFALDRPFKDLRYFLLEICGIIHSNMGVDEIEQEISDCEVDFVEIKENGFVIAGTKRCSFDKSFKLKTPKVDEDDNYHNFDKVMVLTEIIAEETVHYIKGSAVIDENECAVRYITSGKDKSVDMDAYNNMTADEKVQFAASVIEKIGGFVTLPSDIIENTEENNDLLRLDTGSKELIVDEQEIDLNETF